MSRREDENIDRHFLPDPREERIKDEILDETYKKAQVPYKNKPRKRTINKRRPFLKSGVIILAIAILCLSVINFIPWIYIEYDSSVYGTVKETFYFSYTDDFKNEKFENLNIKTLNSTAVGDIYGIFESQCSNCSNDSQNFIGININDFSETAKITSYVFIIMILMSLIFVVFQIVDKMRTFSMETVAIIHSIFAAGIIFAGAYVLVLIIKFFGTYLLIFYNSSFIDFGNSTIVFVVPVILMCIVPFVIIGANAVIKMNFNELKRKLKADIPEDSFSMYNFGGRSR